MIALGQELVAGQELGKIGKESDSGGWFCHLHLQIITQKAMNEGYSEWGYISEKLLLRVFSSPNLYTKWTIYFIKQVNKVMKNDVILFLILLYHP